VTGVAERLINADRGSLGVREEISPGDDMYQGAWNHYFNVGVDALHAIGLALMAARKTGVDRILDLPCGHGRVLRSLRAAFPDARITACDIERRGVDFCAATFDAEPVYSQKDPDEIELDGEYDLIWCGSLLTHLNFDYWGKFLALFRRSLAPDGVLVFTTAGRHAGVILRSALPLFDRVHAAQAGGEDAGPEYEELVLNRSLSSYNLERDRVERLLGEYDRQGFGYVDYQGQVDYGISLASPSHVFEQLEQLDDTRLILFTERGWDNHQDVTACKQAVDTSPFS
jgi:SAM-dependent methyltransferase